MSNLLLPIPASRKKDSQYGGSIQLNNSQKKSKLTVWKHWNKIGWGCVDAHSYWFQRETSMPKFPNHCILKLFQKFSLSKLTVINDYFPDIYLKFLITQSFLKIFPKYRKNFLKIACFKNFLVFPLNFLRISEHMYVNFLRISKYI